MAGSGDQQLGREIERDACRNTTDELADAFRTEWHDLRCYARRRLGDDTLAEETVQETFLRAWRSSHRFDPASGSARMWLFGICRNAVIDSARRRARETRSTRLVHEDELLLDRIPENPTAGEQVRDRAADLLAAMTPPQRDAVVQVLLHGQPYAAVAAALGVPVGTVKSRVHHGLISARRAAA